MDMITVAASIFGADRYFAHAICLTNDPVMVWSYSISNVVIFVSYMAIGGLLLAQHRRAFRLPPVSLILFAAFIILCGLTHVTEAVTLFSGVYRLDLLTRIATAVVSATTAINLAAGAVEGWSNAI